MITGKSKISLWVVAVLAMGALPSSSNAGVVTPDVIFGSNNVNEAWTIDQGNGIELGLRARLRFDDNNQQQNIYNYNGNGSYRFSAGLPPIGFGGMFSDRQSTAVWNFEWSVNSNFDGNGDFLDQFIYELSIDYDPGSGTQFIFYEQIEIPFISITIGDNNTGNGAGAQLTPIANYQALIAANNVAQDSLNMEFFKYNFPGYSFDGSVKGAYTFVLTAFIKNVDGSRGDQLARTEIVVNSVPEPSTSLVFGVICLCGIGARRKRSKSA